MPPASARPRPLPALRYATVGAIAFVVVGNVTIALASLLLKATAPHPRRPAGITGVENLAVVDDRVWRGAAPDVGGYLSLAAAGVTTVVDLRAEANAADLDHDIESLGIDVVHLPIRDGQIPTPADVARFSAHVEGSDGIVFVHCGAGVGRTGSMVAAYTVPTGHSTGVGAAVRNLSIGPPSLEQLVFTARLDGAEFRRPSRPVVVLSRLLDAPRRLWSIAVKSRLAARSARRSNRC